MPLDASLYSAAQLAAAKEILDAFNGLATAHGVFQPYHAAAIVEQADAESSFDPRALGDSDTAYGLFQWHRPRAHQILEGTGVDVTTFPSIADQIEAAQWELQHSSYAVTALPKILAATNAYDASAAACIYWEQAGAPGQPAKRGAGARNWAAYFEAQALAL